MRFTLADGGAVCSGFAAVFVEDTPEEVRDSTNTPPKAWNNLCTAWDAFNNAQ
jgi:hypothetical protein